MSTEKLQKTVVIDVPGLSKGLLNRNREYAPFLCSFSGDDGPQSFSPAFPALTCTAQATLLTGKGPKDHGITANGWYVCMHKYYCVVCCPEGMVLAEGDIVNMYGSVLCMIGC